MVDLPTTEIIEPTFTNDTFSGWYANKDCTGDIIKTIAKEEIGDKVFYGKTTPKSHQVTFDLKGGKFQDTTATTQEVDHDAKVPQPSNPGKEDAVNQKTITSFAFAGWLTADDQEFSFDTLITEDRTLHAKWDETSAAKVTITFRNYDETGDDVLPQKAMKSGETLTIPDAPKENYYFLGWAETPSAANTKTLYVPETYDDVRQVLNAPDLGYLGYTVKSEHEIQNITANRTLYAVYYKGLKATGLADSANPKAQDFIWNDAIWRVVNTVERNTANTRLVVKASALTEEEVTGLGFSLENGADVQYPEATEDNALRVHFQSQNGAADTDNENYFFNGPSDDGYGRSRLKLIIDAYYSQLGDTSAVQAVTLNTPTFTQYLDTGDGTNGFIGTGSTYNNWQWLTDSADGGRYRSYRDASFETTVGGTKQAFALSYGDIHGALGVSTAPGNNNVPLLNFSGTNRNDFWLRSAGGNARYAVGGLYRDAGNVYAGSIYSNLGVNYPLPVRPALSLLIQ